MIEAQKHLKEQYGDDVKAREFTRMSRLLFLVCIFAASLIPLEIFLRPLFHSQEVALILALQEWLRQGHYSQETAMQLARVITAITQADAVRYVMYALYLCGDTMLANKTAIVSFSGIFALNMVKLSYKEPRPYWYVPTVEAYKCSIDFDGPSENTFILMFLGTYLNLIYLRKYARTPSKLLSLFLFLVQALCLVATAISGLLLGRSYLSASLIGVVFGFFWVLVSLQLDNQVHLLIMKSIFIERKARKNKFYLFFLTSGLLIIATTVFNLNMQTWRRPPNLWTTLSNEKCGEASLLGMKGTFLQSSIVLCIPVMVFATSLAIHLEGED